MTSKEVWEWINWLRENARHEPRFAPSTMLRLADVLHDLMVDRDAARARHAAEKVQGEA